MVNYTISTAVLLILITHSLTQASGERARPGTLNETHALASGEETHIHHVLHATQSVCLKIL